ncbi:MAG: hypothetical protein V3V81_02665 [Candidatus Bathyarchaeia archaeon]
MTMIIQSTPETPLTTRMGIILSIDSKAVLSVFLLFFLLSLVKNVLSTIDFMTKTEETGFPLELP